MDIKQLKQKFTEIYGGSEEELRVFISPGRVNLIGEHTDYNGGYVFPAALTMSTTIIARKREDTLINLAATDLSDRVTINPENIDRYKDIAWGNYQAGIISEMQKDGFTICGCDLLYHDTTPHGAGLSSSAAIEVATAFVFATFSNEVSENPKCLDLVQLARIGQRAENIYIGVNCGIMDQFASAMGRKDNVIFLRCKDLSYELVPIKMEGYRLVISNTNKKRSLAASKYNERRGECDEGLRLLQTVLTGKECLGDITVSELEACKHIIKDDVILKRVTHVIYENDRVQRSVEALKNCDIMKFGEYMNASHDSLRDLYEVSCEELDTLVEEARKIEGVCGSRMTGAGFGGCTVSLVRADMIDEFIKETGEAYSKKFGYEASFYISEIGDGARELV